MICSSCGTENEPGRKFCLECGSSLAAICASCGASNAPHAKFCGECGSPLGSAPPARRVESRSAPVVPPAAERRLVSVLFADLVGFTALSEHRDAEDTRELLTRYFDSARDIIARYGGEVEKFIGDAVMAVWGTPVAHEDDAERAVRAALDLVDAVAGLGEALEATDLRLRAGVLTGEAAVTVGAENQGMVAGDLVNTASRLQSSALPGTVLVGRDTYLAASKAISFEAAGNHVVKGKALPVEAWRALRVMAGTGGFRRSGTLEAPFVGREEDIRLLKDLFHTTARERRPRLVSVMGVGGIGKSRLAWEFFKYIDGVVETVFWHQGRCPAYGDGVTFWALGEMVRMRARIAETEDASSSRDKLTAAVEAVVSDADERRFIEPRLAHLLGLEEVAGEREELFSAWRSFFERVSDQGPTVMVFEDLQWADPGLVDFIEHILEWSRTSPIFIVTLARPEVMDKRPTWGAGQRNFISLHLEPLADDDMRKLVSGVVHGLPDHVVDQLIERSEGVPLYAVEIVRMLVDRGDLVQDGPSYRLARAVDRLELPHTLHALIASRLDALEPDDRALLQDASVLGKTFTVDALSALTEHEDLAPRLAALVRKELLELELDPRSPEHGQYGFGQGLIREVAYGTLTKHDRSTKHLGAARYFESIEGGELATVVASHYTEAYRFAPRGPDADALAAEARRALLAAAERASALGAHAQAIASLEKAMSITDDRATIVAMQESAAEAAHSAAMFDTARKYLEEVTGWHETRGDRSAAARTTARLGAALLAAGQLDLAIEKLEAALEEMGGAEVDASVAEMAERLAAAYMLRHESGHAVAWADRALETAERLELERVLADSLITKATAVYNLGRRREGIALVKGALELTQDESLTAQTLRGLNNLAYMVGVLYPMQALRANREGLALARSLGLREWEVFHGASAHDLAMLFSGEWQWAETNMEETAVDETMGLLYVHFVPGKALLRALRGESPPSEDEWAEVESIVGKLTDPQAHAYLCLTRAWTALAEGRLSRSFEQGLAAADTRGGAEYATYGLAVACRAALWMGDIDGTTPAIERLRSIRMSGTWIDFDVRRIEGGMAALEGRADEAARLFHEAIEGKRELGIEFDLALTQLDLVKLVGPHHPDTAAAAGEARDTFTRLGAQPFLGHLESGLTHGITRTATR